VPRRGFEAALAALLSAEGFAMRWRIQRGRGLAGSHFELCERRLLARIQRYTRAAACAGDRTIEARGLCGASCSSGSASTLKRRMRDPTRGPSILASSKDSKRRPGCLGETEILPTGHQ